ncbi:MAG TPA: type II secretion system F family protein [Abditibacteriaceae bacterium]|jgi:type II secretory pathway component PulF
MQRPLQNSGEAAQSAVPASSPKATVPTGAPPQVAVPLKARMVFWRQMATALKGGMTLAATLHHMQAVTSRDDLKEVARKAQICVERGGSFAAWMKTRPQIFSRGEAALVLAGETGGELEAAFARIAQDLEDENTLRRRLFTATFLNKFVVLPLLILVPGSYRIFTHAVEAIDKQGQGMSQFEQQKLALKSGLSGYIHDLIPRLIMVAIIIAALYALRRWMDISPLGRGWRDQIAARIPLTGPLWRDLAVFRYLTALGWLTKAGIAPPTALENCAGMANNVVLDEKFARAARLAREQNVPLGTALQKADVFSEVTLNLIKTGEATGSAPMMLGQAAQYYESDLQGRMITVPKTVGLIGLAIAAVAVVIVVGMGMTAYYNSVYDTVGKFMGVDM